MLTHDISLVSVQTERVVRHWIQKCKLFINEKYSRVLKRRVVLSLRSMCTFG